MTHAHTHKNNIEKNGANNNISLAVSTSVQMAWDTRLLTILFWYVVLCAAQYRQRQQI